jgi:hypothetical protein
MNLKAFDEFIRQALKPFDDPRRGWLNRPTWALGLLAARLPVLLLTGRVAGVLEGG